MYPSLHPHFSENVFTLVSLVLTLCSNTCIKRAEFCLPCIPISRIASVTRPVQVLRTEYNSGSSCLQQLVIQRNSHKVLSSNVGKKDETPRQTLTKLTSCDRHVIKQEHGV